MVVRSEPADFVSNGPCDVSAAGDQGLHHTPQCLHSEGSRAVPEWAGKRTDDHREHPGTAGDPRGCWVHAEDIRWALHGRILTDRESLCTELCPFPLGSLFRELSLLGMLYDLFFF